MSVTAIVALVCAALFTGAAGYISLVEHPARLLLSDLPLLAQWKPSYDKALPIQSTLAIVGGVAGIAAWFVLDDWRWIAGSVALLANWPFTLIAILPTNKRLKAIGYEEAGPESRQLLVEWGNLHAVRTALGVGSTLLFVWAAVVS